MLKVKISKIREIVYENVSSLSPNTREAVIKVYAVGICGSDIHIYLGQSPGAKLPCIRGHEFGGKVKSISDKDNGLIVGDKVTVNPVINCGSCYYCRNEMEHLCENQEVIGGTQ